jgi:hypothetical protein
MAFALPTPSILTAAPKLDIPISPSFRKTTKLYALLLFLFCFTDLMFVSERRVEKGKEYADIFFGRSRNLHGDNTTFEEPVKEAEPVIKHGKLENRDIVRPARLEAHDPDPDPDPDLIVDYTNINGTRHMTRYVYNPWISLHFTLCSSLKASQLRTDNGVSSIYEQADVNAGCKWERFSKYVQCTDHFSVVSEISLCTVYTGTYL